MSRAARPIRIGALLVTPLIGAAAAMAGLDPDAEAGRQLYLTGRSASGATPLARVGGSGTPLPASVMPCANCHGADARGRPEGGIEPPAISWRELSKPYGHRHPNGRNHPAFDAASFARAVTEGIDPAGQRLDPAMPRFVLSERDLADLRSYLVQIDDDRDPGITPDTLRIGTLLPATGPMARFGEVIRAVLEARVATVNRAGGIHGRQLELVARDPGLDADTARDALAALAHEQAFALLCPLVPALDGQLGAEADRLGVPVIGALTQHSEPDAQLLFQALPGLREQFLALAEFATRRIGLADPVARILRPDAPYERAVADELEARLRAHGWHQVAQWSMPAADDVPDRADRLSREGVQALFYLGTEARLAPLLAAARARMVSPYVFAAASQAAAAASAAPTQFTERIFLAYPSLPSDWSREGRDALDALQSQPAIGRRHAALQIDAFAASAILFEALKRSGRAPRRSGLVAALEGLHDFETGLTQRMSFGPGRRIGAAGAHVVTVDLQARRFLPTGPFMSSDLLRE